MQCGTSSRIARFIYHFYNLFHGESLLNLFYSKNIVLTRVLNTRCGKPPHKAKDIGTEQEIRNKNAYNGLRNNAAG